VLQRMTRAGIIAPFPLFRFSRFPCGRFLQIRHRDCSAISHPSRVITAGLYLVFGRPSADKTLGSPLTHRREAEAPAHCSSPTTDEVARRKKISASSVDRPRVSWPVALRQVRSWLEPWIMLWRYWRAWSTPPPPGALQQLLDWLWQGRGISLYESA